MMTTTMTHIEKKLGNSIQWVRFVNMIESYHDPVDNIPITRLLDALGLHETLHYCCISTIICLLLMALSVLGI